MKGSALTEIGSIPQPPSLNPHANPVRPPRHLEPLALLEQLQRRLPVALGRAVTLIESTAPKDQEAAIALTDLCQPLSGGAIRVGITGVPGVGKSTFIEALGMHLVENLGRRLAVLAVDPSSERSGGSILGDKARMPRLSAHPNAFVRPSPTRGTLGGVSRKTRETVMVCEAAGFDVVFIETVGVGQSEIAVHGMVDTFLLLMLAGAGDELQGMKRGIMEMADVLAITKVDGENVGPARRAQGQTMNALRLFPTQTSGWQPPVVLCSALTGSGVVEVWTEVVRHNALQRQSGGFEHKRTEQSLEWMRDEVMHALTEDFFRDPEVQQRLSELEAQVRAGTLTPRRAARRLIEVHGGGV